MASLGASFTPSALNTGYPKTLKLELSISINDKDDEDYYMSTNFKDDLKRELYESLMVTISSTEDIKITLIS